MSTMPSLRPWASRPQSMTAAMVGRTGARIEGQVFRRTRSELGEKRVRRPAHASMRSSIRSASRRAVTSVAAAGSGSRWMPTRPPSIGRSAYTRTASSTVRPAAAVDERPVRRYRAPIRDPCRDHRFPRLSGGGDDDDLRGKRRCLLDHGLRRRRLSRFELDVLDDVLDRWRGVCGSVTVVCTVVVAVPALGAANAVIRALAVATAPIPNAIRRGRASGRPLANVAEGLRTVAAPCAAVGGAPRGGSPVPDAGHQSSPPSSSDSPRAALTTLWTVIVFCFAGGAT